MLATQDAISRFLLMYRRTWEVNNLADSNSPIDANLEAAANTSFVYETGDKTPLFNVIIRTKKWCFFRIFGPSRYAVHLRTSMRGWHTTWN